MSNPIIRMFLIVLGMALLGACQRDPLSQGLQALGKGDAAQARILLQRAADINPGDPSALANLGIAYLRLGQTNEALEAFRKASALALNDPRPLEFMATIAAAQGQWKLAAGHLTEAVRRDPQSPRIQTALAVAELQFLGPQAAKTRLDSVLGTAPNYSPAVINLALLNKDWLKNPDEAKALFQRYLKISRDPERVALARRALTDLEASSRIITPPPVRKPEPVKEPAPLPNEKPVAHNPQAAAEAYNRGVRSHMAGDYDRALQDYSRAVQNDPGMANAHYNLGLVFRARNELSKSRSALQQALAIAPGMADARYMLALVLRDLREPAACLAELNTLLEKNPRYAPAHHALGQLYKDDPAKRNLAKEAFRHYLELAPDGPSAREARNWLKYNP